MTLAHHNLVIPFNPPGEWVTQAACSQSNAHLFYPNSNGWEDAVQAKAICLTCPVVEQCLAYAMDNHERFGVWGGLTPDERTAARRVAKAECKNGHPRTAEGVYVRPDGRRECRACMARRREERAAS